MNYRAITFASTAFLVTSLALANDTWVLDPGKSNARLFQGPNANSDSVNAGVARVTGKVKLDASDLDASIFDLSIYPADESWEHVLSPEGALPVGHAPDATGQTLLTFRSTCILRTGNGQLEVIGNLTLTRVERTVIATPTEANAGPAYRDPVIHNETREITFLFPTENVAHLSGGLTPAVLHTMGVLEIVGASRFEREEFPELLSAITNTTWPPLVQDKDCHMPSAFGEDYSGAVCTGALNAATRDNNRQTPALVGEDYSGSQCNLTTGDRSTIVLDLTFLHKLSEPEVGMLSGSSEAR